MITAQHFQEAAERLSPEYNLAQGYADGRQSAATEILGYMDTRRQRLSEIALMARMPDQQNRARAAMTELESIERKIREAFHV